MFKPTHFGKYYLTDRIAVGGMAEIFKATLYGVSGFEKPMVVKQILPQYARNAEFIKMFIDEAKIAVSLTHGNIIPVYELGRIDGIYFIAMEYVHGKNLAELLDESMDQCVRMSPENALYVAIEICKGLDYAHRRVDAQGEPLGVVHRDISPPNVLLSMTGEVKLADFGIAKAQHKLGSTDAGVVKGTYGYMSPEQLNGEEVDARTDIFSCGILFHEMLTGQRLFSGGSDIEAIERVKEAYVPAPSILAPGIPATMDPIVLKALAKDASQRYQSASELQMDLSRLLYADGSGASAATLARHVQNIFPRTAADSSSLSPIAPPKAPVPPKKDNSTQSYAVRDVLDHVETQEKKKPSKVRVGTAPRVSGPMGGGAISGATKAMSSIPEPEGLEPLPLFDDMDVNDTDPDPVYNKHDLEKTAVFHRQGPKKPDVPELRFSTKSGLQRLAPADSEDIFGGNVDAALDSLDAKDSVQATASPADAALFPADTDPDSPGPGGTDEVPTPHAPAPTNAQVDPAIAVISPSANKGPRRDASLMAMLTRPPTEEQPAVNRAELDHHLEHTFGPSVPAQPAQPAQPLAAPDAAGPSVSSGGESSHQRKKRPPSSALSATMKLFIQGLDNEELHPDAASGGTAEYGNVSSGMTGMTGIEDTIPRTIKPTVLGWILIGVIVLGAGLFVLYKKTTLLSSDDQDSGSLLGDDIKLPAPDAGPKKAVKADLIIEPTPADAFLFLHVGDAPITVRVDPGIAQLLRVEREGYQTAHRTVKPADFTDGKASIKVTIAPVGAGAAEQWPEIEKPAGTTGERTATIEVTSDPPAASVWLLLGKGRSELKKAEAKRYYIKALGQGHEPAFLTVSSDEFASAGGGMLHRKIKLDPRPSADAAPAVAPDAAAKVEPKRAAVKVKRVRKKPRVRKTSKSRRKKPRATKKTTPKKTTKKKPRRKPKKSITLPSWAK